MSDKKEPTPSCCRYDNKPDGEPCIFSGWCRHNKLVDGKRKCTKKVMEMAQCE